MDKPLSVVMTFRMFLHDMCFLLLLFNRWDLNHSVRVFYSFMVQGNERHCEAQLVCRNEKEDGLCCKWAFIECHGIFSI